MNRILYNYVENIKNNFIEEKNLTLNNINAISDEIYSNISLNPNFLNSYIKNQLSTSFQIGGNPDAENLAKMQYFEKLIKTYKDLELLKMSTTQDDIEKILDELLTNIDLTSNLETITGSSF